MNQQYTMKITNQVGNIFKECKDLSEEQW